MLGEISQKGKDEYGMTSLVDRRTERRNAKQNLTGFGVLHQSKGLHREGDSQVLVHGGGGRPRLEVRVF